MTEPKTPGDLIVARAIRHFESLGLRTVEVPEWGEGEGKPLVIHYTPITIAEKQDILREAALSAGGEHGAARCIIMKALDAQGQPLFTLAHKHWLVTRVYGPVVERLYEALTATNLKPPPPPGKGETAEEAHEKN